MWINASCTSSGREDDKPCKYISSVSRPQGSIKSWCLSLSLNLTILSSNDGQYLGPLPSILPEYIGLRSRLSRIICFVFSFEYVMWQHTLFLGASSVSKLKGTVSSSPSCSSRLVKSIDFLLTRDGVPVLNLRSGISSFLSAFESSVAGNIPSGPLSYETSPM